MTKKPRSTQGTVINKVKDIQILSQWAQEFSGLEFFQKALLSKEALQKAWVDYQGTLQFFSANNPKEAQNSTFETQHGLIVFSDQKAQEILDSIYSLEFTLPSEGGLVVQAYAREGYKNLMKYMLLAAERIVHEKQNQIFCFVLENDSSMARFVKSSGYEELSKVQSKTNPAVSGVIFHKILTS